MQTTRYSRSGLWLTPLQALIDLQHFLIHLIRPRSLLLLGRQICYQTLKFFHIQSQLSQSLEITSMAYRTTQTVAPTPKPIQNITLKVYSLSAATIIVSGDLFSFLDSSDCHYRVSDAGNRMQFGIWIIAVVEIGYVWTALKHRHHKKNVASLEDPRGKQSKSVNSAMPNANRCRNRI